MTPLPAFTGKGRYVVRVDSAELRQARDNTVQLWVAKLTVLATTNRKHPIGTVLTWVHKVARLVSVFHDEQIWQGVPGAQEIEYVQTGRVIGLETDAVMTRSGNVFVRHRWFETCPVHDDCRDHVVPLGRACIAALGWTELPKHEDRRIANPQHDQLEKRENDGRPKLAVDLR
jgi:hypothetical protein